jgi:hypothetical protein
MIDYPQQYTKPEPVWKGIPGFFDWEQAYSRVAAECPEGGIMVEVGCFLGRSACYMGEELQRLKKSALLLCVDVWPYNYRYGEFIYAEGPFETFCANVRQSGLTRFIVPIRSDSLAAARFISGGLFSVFIDADHSYEGCKADILAWKDKVIKGGYVYGHDYGDGCWEGVKRAVHDVFGSDVAIEGQTWIHQVK